jgi:XTP/dITP diphosphohydrolase
MEKKYRLVIASGNRGKIKEIGEILGREPIPYSQLLPDLEIVEDGDSFKANAILKARGVWEGLRKKYPGETFLVLSDDSGLVVPLLNGAPGIYSARYAGESATDEDNRAKLIRELKKRKVTRTPAYYVASIGLATPWGVWTSHGFMYGEVIDEERGEHGFGYDFLFIPRGFTQTLGELEPEIKNRLSHRRMGLEGIKPVLKVMEQWVEKF